jgi:hypothetical protein
MSKTVPTTAFDTKWKTTINSPKQNVFEASDSESDDEDDAIYEVFLDHCQTNDVNDNDPALLHTFLEEFSLRHISNQGFQRSGSNKHTPKVKASTISTPWVAATPVNLQPTSNPTTNNQKPDDPTLQTVVRVFLRRRRVKARPKVFEYNADAFVCEATGTMESVLEWGTAAKLNTLQKRAFESIIAAFILTFHEFADSDYDDVSLDDETRERAKKAKKQFLFLKGGTDDGVQLILLLHGMGGSGKSTVICLV